MDIVLIPLIVVTFYLFVGLMVFVMKTEEELFFIQENAIFDTPFFFILVATFILKKEKT